jgi:hypothetical protein
VGSAPAAGEDLVARSIAVLESVGFRPVPLLHPIADVWPILCVSPRGLTVAAPVTEKPNLMGATYGALPGWPPTTVRLVLVWGEGPLPKAITL